MSMNRTELELHFSQLQTYVCLCKIKTKNRALFASMLTH
jgi:hypothetical protein